MKLTIIVTGLDVGGAEVMLMRLIERFDPSRYDMQVVSLSRTGDIGRRIAEAGVQVCSLGMTGGIGDVLKFWRLVKFLRKEQPDIANTWMYHANLLGGLAARLAGVHRIVWSVHNSTLDSRKTKPLTRAVAWACTKLSFLPDAIVFCSEVARAVHLEQGYRNKCIRVLPNGYDLSLFKPDPEARASLRAELKIAGDVPLVGLIGRFDEQKNHIGFCNAARIVKTQVPDVRFVLAGRNIDTTNVTLTRAMETAGISREAVLLGLRDDMPRIMASLDVLVSASSYGEAFPNVLAEAMACGVLCATTNVGDSAGIVGHTGRVVPPEDVVGLAEAVVYLLTLPSEVASRLRGEARCRISENFDIRKIARDYQDFYESMLTASGRVSGHPTS